MNAPASHPPLSGTKLLLGTVALSLATFMNVLDTTIANVSIPAISGDLGVSSSQGTWVITSFAVANAIAVPLTGWLTSVLARCVCSSPRCCCLCWPRCCAGWPPIWKC